MGVPEPASTPAPAPPVPGLAEEPPDDPEAPPSAAAPPVERPPDDAPPVDAPAPPSGAAPPDEASPDAPPDDAPPVDAPPVDTPAEGAPPVDASAPPLDVPPAAAPPDAPPVDVPPDPVPAELWLVEEEPPHALARRVTRMVVRKGLLCGRIVVSMCSNLERHPIPAWRPRNARLHRGMIFFCERSHAGRPGASRGRLDRGRLLVFRPGRLQIRVMKSNPQPERRRTTGAGLRMVIAIGALVSGCYYRGCACDHRRHGGEWGHDRGREREHDRR